MIAFIAVTLNTAAQKMTAPDSAKYLLDTTIRIMQKKAFNADQVNWDALKKELFRKVEKINSVKEAGFAFTRLFDELKDVHGIFYYSDSFFRSNNKPRNEGKINETTYEELKKGSRIISKMLAGNIAFINIPFISQQDTASVIKIANRINDSIVQLLKQDAKGLIIDLRLNQGGNVYPMIAGLHSVFNDGKVSGLYSYEFKDKDTPTYFYKDSLICEYYHININRPWKHSNIPVAVLIGPSTASAGEGTAAALTFRDRSMLIGEESMGLTTANDGFIVMQPDIGFNLSVGVIKDGNGNKLTDAIKPGIIVNGGDNFVNLEEDTKVIAAKEWISNNL